MSEWVCVCVCVFVSERERVRECVCVCVCEGLQVWAVTVFLWASNHFYCERFVLAHWATYYSTASVCMHELFTSLNVSLENVVEMQEQKLLEILQCINNAKLNMNESE